MPTGYTDELDKSGFDTKKWITESIVRAFGVCVAFRENGRMTKEEILKALKKSGTYYEKELKKAIAEVEKLKIMDETQWNAMMQKANEDEMNFYKERSKEHKDIREGHEKVKTALVKFKNEDISTVTANIVRFGLEQLDLVKGDYKEEALPTPCGNANEFKTVTLEKAHKDIVYYRNELNNEKEREMERLDVYKQVLKDCELLD
jgi:hypothetical protein